MFVGELYNLGLMSVGIILQIIQELLTCDLDKITPEDVTTYNKHRKWI